MENKLGEYLRSAIRVLVIQEVRYLRTEQACPSPFILGEIRRCIQETKDRVRALTRSMDPRERDLLIKQIVDQSVEEEIDEAIEVRKNRCLRCIHLKYLDETGTAHLDLPCGVDREGARDVSALEICCENPPTPGAMCEAFAEKLSVLPLEEYLAEIHFFYEVRDMLDRLDEIWDEYLNR